MILQVIWVQTSVFTKENSFLTVSSTYVYFCCFTLALLNITFWSKLVKVRLFAQIMGWKFAQLTSTCDLDYSCINRNYMELLFQPKLRLTGPSYRFFGFASSTICYDSLNSHWRTLTSDFRCLSLIHLMNVKYQEVHDLGLCYYRVVWSGNTSGIVSHLWKRPALKSPYITGLIRSFY